MITIPMPILESTLKSISFLHQLYGFLIQFLHEGLVFVVNHLKQLPQITNLQ